MKDIPPLSHIPAFEAAARFESFARAAKELGITSTAVSQHIRALEDWFGTPLFIRKARGVQLTKQGQQFASTCQTAIREIANSAAQISPKKTKRKVSLACQPSVVSLWLTNRLPDFMERHPDIQVSIVYPFGAAMPEEVGADLLIRHGTIPDQAAEKILSAETRPTCARSYLEKDGPFNEPSALLQARLLHDETEEAWRQWLRQYDLDLPSGSAPVFGDFNLLISSIQAGYGIGLCPTSLIEQDISEGKLVVLSEDATDKDKYYWLIRAQSLSDDAEMLRQWLRDQAAF